MAENVTQQAELYWQESGQGPDLVLIHGWGMNGAVWQQTVDTLSQHFTVHVVDLPGYGHSSHCHADNLEGIGQLLLRGAPDKAAWLGWSLGGLVASYLALYHPDRVSKLITVASSPKFSAEGRWRGIQPQVLSQFSQQLTEDFTLTVERFMALQAMGSPSARQDVKQLKQSVLSRPMPDPHSLTLGLQLLAEVDLRQALATLQVPMLRLYGRLDGLVPVKVAAELDRQWPESESHVFAQSSHAPFITESEQFCQRIVQFLGK